MDAKAHWEHVYQTKGPEQVSWFQPEATLSLELITHLAPSRDARILDVGAGASTLVDGLLTAGYRQLTVLDLSRAALQRAQRRLGALAARVQWLESDLLTAALAASGFDVWHDRAVFHFLTEAADRVRYVEQVRRAVHPGGIVLVATFADDGPRRCSGLDVRGYSPDALHSEFGADFRLIERRREEHVTPQGTVQAFTYCGCRYEPHERVRPAE
jgi:SAM-dependent methyltransferase